MRLLRRTAAPCLRALLVDVKLANLGRFRPLPESAKVDAYLADRRRRQDALLRRDVSKVTHFLFGDGGMDSESR